MMKKLLSLALTLVLLSSVTVFAQGGTTVPNQKKTEPISINCYDPSEIPLPKGLKTNEIEGVSVSKGSSFIPVKIEIDNDVLTITPTEYFEHGKEYTVKIFTGSKKYEIPVKAANFKVISSYDGTIMKIPPKKGSGFNFPYYIYLPENMEKTKSETKRLIVEPNNTGSVSDLLEYHDEAALRMVAANGGPGHYAAYYLNYPFLVPVFPRQATNWWESYTHALDKGAMLLEGEAKRLDLQLMAMIEDARKILSGMGYRIEKKVFMTGFSASGQFTNRFATLHPEIVKAIAVGNFTMYPTAKLNGVTLNYPWGIADIKKYTGKEFNKAEYDKIAQFCYIGDEDQNDQPFNVDYGISEEETKAVNDLFGYDSGVTRWNRKWKFVKQLGYDKSIQFHTYKGIGHGISENILKDVLEFFRVNNGDRIIKIKAHTNAY
ncbi:MAG TPA: hypothetical protein GX501_04745 [Clostridiaceae bacterium]|nr:hypothetical protein [Clostridiaceae bacterium]